MATNNATSFRHNVFAEAMDIQMWKNSKDEDSTPVSYHTPVRYWFDENDVNDIEREYVENIFWDYTSSIDDALYYYVDIRSQIINLYQQNTKRYLTPSDCIEAINADPSSIARVYCLLNYWQIINYEALRTVTEDDGYLSQFKREIDVIKGKEQNEGENDIGDILPTTAIECDDDNVSLKQIRRQKDELAAFNAPFTAVPSTLESYKLNSNQEPRACQSCQKPCEYSYYVISDMAPGDMLERFKDSLWCSWCYSNSLYPLAIPKHALVRVLVPLGADGSDHTLIVSNWDDNKWERLYDIIDRVGLDWERVRIEMGSDVTVRECMYHFIIAPLEQDTRGLIRLPVCFGNVYNGRDEIPFFTSENTITAFLAFCASMLSPVVASRAAKVILDRVMQEISPSPQSTIGKESEWSAKDAESMGPNAPIFLDSYQVNSASQGEDFHDLGFMMSGGQRLRGNSSLYGFRAKPTDQYIGTGAEYENTGPSFMSNHTIDDSTLYGAFKDALQSSTDTCSELAEMQQEKINDLLEQLIELKIKRIKHKLNVYASTCEQMNNNEVKMRLELSQILQCDSNT